MDNAHLNNNTDLNLQTDTTNTVFVVDVLDSNAPTNKTNKILTELSCGHTVEGSVNTLDRCPECNKSVCENTTLKKKKFILRTILIALGVITLILAFLLLRPVSFTEIAGDKIEQVREDQKEQLNSYASLNYHTRGFTWAKATLSGKLPVYTPEMFSLKPGAVQGFFDKDNNLLFGVITTDDLNGSIAYIDAQDKSIATLYEVY